MYIFVLPDQTIEMREVWDVEYKPPIGTYIYEPDDSVFPWCLFGENGPKALPSITLPKFCRTVELLYPRGSTKPTAASIRDALKQSFKG
jgi:hypothetical protein